MKLTLFCAERCMQLANLVCCSNKSYNFQLGEGAYRAVVIEYLNLVFGTSNEAAFYWDSTITVCLAQKFLTFAPPNNLQKEFISRSVAAGIKDGRYTTNQPNFTSV